MITNFEIFQEAIDLRRTILGLGALGGGLYGAHLLGNAGENIGMISNTVTQQNNLDTSDRDYRMELLNKVKENPLTSLKNVVRDQPEIKENLIKQIKTYNSRAPEDKQFSLQDLSNASNTGATIGGLTGLGLGGLAGAGLSRLIIGKDPNKQKK